MNDHLLLGRMTPGPVDTDALAAGLDLAPAELELRLQRLAAAGVALAQDAGGRWCLQQRPDLHDRQALLRALAPATRAGLGTLDVLWEVTSTNAELLGRPLPQSGIDVLLAQRQTAGRGRRGRDWASPLGRHLYLSLACRFESGLAAMAGLSLAVGVVVAQVLRELGAGAVGLKWPNDLLLDGHKLGGILVESAGAGRGPAVAVIGIGVNVHAGELAGIDQPWTTLDRHCAQPPGRDRLAVLLLDALVPALERFRQHGLAAFLPAYAALDLLAGQAVWVHDGQGRHPALALGLAEDGALRIVDADGERRLHAGHVSVRKQ